MTKTIDDYAREVLLEGTSINYGGCSTASNKSSEPLTAKEVRSAIKELKKHIVKPKWRVVPYFPFLAKCYVIPPLEAQS